MARLCQRIPHGSNKLVKRTCKGSLAGNETESDPVGWRERSLSSVGFSQPPPGPVSHHAAPESATYSKANGPRASLAVPQQHERRAFHTHAAPEEPLEFCPGPEALGPR